MKETNYIADVAEIFHIRASTLRYWDEEGLIRFERSPDNNYRKTSIQTLADISEVILFRSLSIPLKEIRRIPTMGLEDLNHMLEKNESNLLKEIARLQESIQKIENKKRTVEKLKYLKANPFTLEKTALPAISRFSFHDAEAVDIYVHDPYQTVVIFQPEQPDPPDIGIILPKLPANPCRRADQTERLYLRGLLQIDSACDLIHNGMDFVEQARSLGYSGKELIGRYLISTYEGKRFDYYEAWMPLIPAKC